MKQFIISLILVVVAVSCMNNPPAQVDGDAYLKIEAVMDTSKIDSLHSYMPIKNAKVLLSSEYGIRIENTDENGICILTTLPSSTYSISVRAEHPEDQNILIVGNQKDIEINSGTTVEVKISAQAVSSSGIAINELYVGGPENNFYYFYDQYIELYNSSDSVKYLDGNLVMRISGNNDFKGPGADEDNDGDIDGITYIFKFPGKPGEKNYPFEPKTYKVLAQDAVDHSSFVSTSINLSTADWEFVNQLSTTDFDNSNVPNLTSIRYDRHLDFLISVAADVIVLASGQDTVWADGIDIETVLDGVEYQTKGTSRMTLDDRVDRGWVRCPPKYGGQSMQRRDPGVDTNEGTLDWEILQSPTPGYHK